MQIIILHKTLKKIKLVNYFRLRQCINVYLSRIIAYCNGGDIEYRNLVEHQIYNDY
jgi:hypothetical protein